MTVDDARPREQDPDPDPGFVFGEPDPQVADAIAAVDALFADVSDADLQRVGKTFFHDAAGKPQLRRRLVQAVPAADEPEPGQQEPTDQV